MQSSEVARQKMSSFASLLPLRSGMPLPSEASSPPVVFLLPYAHLLRLVGGVSVPLDDSKHVQWDL